MKHGFHVTTATPGFSILVLDFRPFILFWTTHFIISILYALCTLFLELLKAIYLVLVRFCFLVLPLHNIFIILGGWRLRRVPY